MDGELDCRSDETRAVPILVRFSVRCCFVDREKLIIHYTDGHDVDEDSMTIPHYGGWWTYGTRVGVAYRELYNAPNVLAAVAYKDKNTTLSSRMVFLMI